MSDILFVAEIGSNHKGIKALAHEMVRQAALAGADIAKFQLGWSKNIVGGSKEWMRYQPMEWAQEIMEWCDYYGIEFMASIWGRKGLELACELGVKRLKIPYLVWRDFKELSELVLSQGKETFISGGTHSNNELARPIYCIPEYPVYPDKLVLPSTFHPDARTTSWYGYSSHAHGIADALLAIARGALYIEKHVTLDKTEESIRDNAFALSFEEFGEMVRTGRDIARLL